MGPLDKRKTDSSARERTRKLFTSEYKNSCPKKRKIFFIPMKVQVITISSVIPYILKINSTSSSLKKKKSANEKGREKEKEKGGRENEKERKREWEKEGE